jgi:hypothetical protein
VKAIILNIKDNVAADIDNVNAGEIISINENKRLDTIEDIPGKVKKTYKNKEDTLKRILHGSEEYMTMTNNYRSGQIF